MRNLTFQAFLRRFYSTDQGQALLQEEQALLKHSLSHLFGYFLVQIGQTTPQNLLGSSRISRKVLADSDLISLSVNADEVIQRLKADIEYLPFKNDSIDVVVLPHTLETVEDPFHLLRQVDNMIVPEGRLVISGFNPIGKTVLKLRFWQYKVAFKQAHLVSEKRLVDWLNVLGYEFECIHYPRPVISERFGLDKLQRVLFWLANKAGVEFGNIYVIVAKKRIESFRPVGLNWQLSNWLPSKNRRLIRKPVSSSEAQIMKLKKKMRETCNK